MARKRMIDPNIWDSEDFSSLSFIARLLFIGMISNADDEGRGVANPTYLKSHIFPYEEELRTTDIENALSQIARSMSIVLYTHDGKRYYEFSHWREWQKIDRPTPSKLPDPDLGEPIYKDSMNDRRGLDEDSSNDRRTLDEGSLLIEKNRKEKNRKEQETRASGFEKFWEEYPRKEKKTAARQKWEHLDPDDALQEKILADIALKKTTEAWREDGGRYIPQPTTYLNQRRWEDEFKPAKSRGQPYAQHDNTESDLDHLLTNLDE